MSQDDEGAAVVVPLVVTFKRGTSRECKLEVLPEPHHPLLKKKSLYTLMQTVRVIENIFES